MHVDECGNELIEEEHEHDPPHGNTHDHQSEHAPAQDTMLATGALSGNKREREHSGSEDDQ